MDKSYKISYVDKEVKNWKSPMAFVEIKNVLYTPSFTLPSLFEKLCDVSIGVRPPS